VIEGKALLPTPQKEEGPGPAPIPNR